MGHLTKTYQEFEKANFPAILRWEKFSHFELTYHSTAIEGSSLSLTQVQLLLDEGMTPGGNYWGHSCMVLDHYEALQFILQEAAAHKPISEALIQAVGAKVNRRVRNTMDYGNGVWNDAQGEYRRVDVRAGDHVFIPYKDVPKATKQFVADMNARLDKVEGVEEVYELAFKAHFDLVSIHPFGDGNGRTSRLLMNYIQAYHKKPLTLVFYKDKEEYIDSLKRSRKENSEAMQNFMKSQAIKYFEKWLRALEESKNRKYDFSFSK